MAIRHVAWLRFKDGVSRDRIEKHMAACRALVGRVPVVQNRECGPNLTDRAGGFTHCMPIPSLVWLPPPVPAPSR